MGKLVIIECGLRLRRAGNGYVKREQVNRVSWRGIVILLFNFLYLCNSYIRCLITVILIALFFFYSVTLKKNLYSMPLPAPERLLSVPLFFSIL
jgi:hypothetical protein